MSLTEATVGTPAPALLGPGTRLLLDLSADFNADAYLDWLATQMTPDGP